MSIKYIFDPDYVRSVLKDHPNLKNSIPEPENEGEKTASFPMARKTDLEIYLILSNPQYPHLKALIKTFENCLCRGWNKKSLIGARGRNNFRSLLPELELSAYFLERRFNVHNYDREEGKPDIEVVDSKGTTLELEVYSPRDWEGYYEFMEDLRLVIMHLDMPWDFKIDVKVDTINDFDDASYYKAFDPVHFSKLNKRFQDRFPRIQRILYKLKIGLNKQIGKNTLKCLTNFKELNTKITVKLSKMVQACSTTPTRPYYRSGPGYSGYNPEGMFNYLLNKKIKYKKIKKFKKKGICKNLIHGLFVNLSKLAYYGDVSYNLYFNSFAKIVSESMKSIDLEKVNNYDLIVFGFTNMRVGSDLKIPIIYRKPNVLKEQIIKFLGNESMIEEFSDNVFICNYEEVDKIQRERIQEKLRSELLKRIKF